MFDAQILQTKSDGSSVSVFSPWLRRGGDRALMTLDVIAATLTAFLAELNVQLFHKNSEDTGPGTQVGSTTITATGSGRTTAEFGTVKELVRYKFTITAGGSNDLRWALFRMLGVVWFDAVKG